MTRFLRSALRLLALLPCLLGSPARSYAGEPTQVAAAFRIRGVVVSARDGSPIAKCKVSVVEAGRMISRLMGTESVPDDAGNSGRNGRQRRTYQPRANGGATGADDLGAVVTDTSGQFSVTVAKAGVWRLSGRAKGYRAESYDQHDQFWSGVVLTSAAPEITLTLRLTPDATITGTVFDEAGEGVRNAQVRVEAVRTPGPNEGLRGVGGAFNTATDDRGMYEVSGLQPGKYRVSVNAQPWYANSTNQSTNSSDPSLDLVYVRTWYPAAIDLRSAEAIAINGGEEIRADFHLTPVPSVHLRIPLPSQALRSEDGAGRPIDLPGPIVTREDDEGLPSNSVAVSVTEGKDWDVGGLTPGRYSVRFLSGELQGQKQITIAPNSAAFVGMGSATVAPKLTITIDGVDDSDVRQVTLVDVNSRESFRTSMRQDRRGPGDEDEDDVSAGARTLTVPPGRYEVYLNGSRGLYLSGMTATGAKVTGRTLELSGGNPKLVLHAIIGEGEVDGLARREGKAVSGAMVLLVPAGYGKLKNVAPVERAESNTDGSFAVASVIPGEYILVVIDHGWDVNWRDSATLAQYLTNGIPVNLPGSATVHKEVEAIAP